MDYQIIELEEFNVIGIRYELSKSLSNNVKLAQNHWKIFNSKLRNNLLEKNGLNLNDQKVNKVLKKLSKHKGKLAAGVGIGAAAIELSKKKNIPTTIKKSKSAKNAGRRTAEERTKHMTKDDK